MRCMLVDDEPLARERLARLLSDQGGYELIGQAGNGQDALAMIEAERPDLVLLDIAMPGMNGLELATHLNTLASPPAVIFCTAYDEHALAAFDARAIDYLLKPVRAERLAEALERARHYCDADLSKVRNDQHSQRQHICARVRGNLELIPVDQIIYFHAEHKYVTVCHENGEVLIEEALTSLENDLGERFLRIHRNALVDTQRIAGLVRRSDGQFCVRMAGCDTLLDVSRRNLPRVRRLLKKLESGLRT